VPQEREWNERQLAALQRLAENLEHGPEEVLEAGDPLLADISLPEYLLEHRHALMCPRLLMFHGVPESHTRVNLYRGAQNRGTLYIDSASHLLYISDYPGDWHGLGPDEFFQIQRGPVNGRAFVIREGDWDDLAFCRFSPPGQVVVRLKDENAIQAIRDARMQQSQAEILIETAPATAANIVSAIDADSPIPLTGQMDFCFLVIVDGYGALAKYEILSGPHLAADVREEMRSLGRNNYPERLVVKRYRTQNPPSICSGCIRPNSQYKHQAHCSSEQE
jgi:hypothetical protein